VREKLTIVIPTHERQRLLERRVLPNALASRGRILVIDSSAAPNTFAARHPDVDYVHCPGQNLTKKMQAPVLERVRTPYMLLNADDTLTNPRAVRLCLEFLEAHPDYSSAMGLDFQTGQGGEGLACPQFKRFPFAVDAERPGDRLLQNFLFFWSSYYAVQRTDMWRDIFSRCPQTLRNYYLFETYIVLMAAIHGKLAKLPLPFTLMEAGPSINDRDPRFHSSPFKLATDPRYGGEVQDVRQAVDAYLAERAGIPLEQARVFVDGALAMYWLQDKPVRTCADKLRREWQRLLDKTILRTRARARRAAARDEARVSRRCLLEQALDFVGPEGRADLDELLALIRAA